MLHFRLKSINICSSVVLLYTHLFYKVHKSVMSHQNCCSGDKSTDKKRIVIAQSAVMTVVNSVVAKSSLHVLLI